MKIQFHASQRIQKTVELMGVGVFDSDKNLSAVSQLPSSVKEEFRRVLASKKFSAKDGEALLVTGLSRFQGAILALGLGKKEKLTLQKIRLQAVRVISQAKALKLDEAALDLDSFGGRFSLGEIAGSVVEGARLSNYRFDRHKSKPSVISHIQSFLLFSSEHTQNTSVKKALNEAEIISEAVAFTRDLANEPANVMTPVRLARTAKEMAAKNNLICKVLGESEIKRLGMGGLIGVSQGSALPPQFIILENKSTSKEAPIVFVGKGITFDTGGISIKPAGDMDKMKFDMCGAAAVIGTMKAVANLKLPIKVIGLVPTCENMPGSTAQRPGDVIKIMSGKTVEVLNTDAEGRLILADALSYAQRYKPKALIDIATLTGACAVTFADLASGVMGTDEDLVNRLLKAGELTGERLWELPLWDEYYDLIKATYADIQNISKKYAGTITAGMFLKEFADHTKSWAHLDVAGTAWNDGGPKPLSPIGATGVGVRTFIQLLKSYL